MNLKILCLFFMLTGQALAAQVGQIVVDQAPVHQYPQTSSKVMMMMNRGDTVPVSNLPTEGFYKARLPNGETGWISGNDVLASPSGEVNTRSKRKPPQARPEISEDEEPAEEPKNSFQERTRIAFSGGVQSLSYTGLSENFEKTSPLNLGSSFAFEIDRIITSSLFWGVRIEYFAANTGEQKVSNATKTQTIKVKDIPLQIGLIWSPADSRKFRFGLGFYVGATVSSSTTIEQTDATTTGNVGYNSVDPVATIATQFVFKMGSKVGLMFEGDYHYQQTGTLAATTQLGNIPAFKINYSGLVGRVGLELRF